MNKPENYRTKEISSLEDPRVLNAADYRYYYRYAAGLEQPLVFWSQPYGDYPAMKAGTHDGMRDGSFGGSAPKNYLDAGNPNPR